jgi:uncharacterized protein (UPF0335 family)
MAYLENEFEDIMNLIDRIINEYKNREFIIDALKEISNLRKKLSINPGLVAMCAGSMIEKIKAEEIEEERKYLIRAIDGKEYYGIARANDSTIFVENYEIPLRDVSEIFIINDKTIEKFWPTLLFEVRKK